MHAHLRNRDVAVHAHLPNRAVAVHARLGGATMHRCTGKKDSPWSRFGEMRRAVRGLLAFSLFTLFLSTSGTLFGITPAPGRDFSSRMLLEGEVMMPFCELGFDQLAQILDFGKMVKLSQVTSDEHLISYGRPLCVLNVHCVRHLILPQIPSGIPIWTTGKYIPLCSPEAAGWHSI